MPDEISLKAEGWDGRSIGGGGGICLFLFSAFLFFSRNLAEEGQNLDLLAC